MLVSCGAVVCYLSFAMSDCHGCIIQYNRNTMKRVEGRSKSVRVTFLRGADDAKDGWERVERNQKGQRKRKEAEEGQI